MSGAELVAGLSVTAALIQIGECCVKIGKVIHGCNRKGILENLEPKLDY
jgi:hypothetical protein